MLHDKDIKQLENDNLIQDVGGLLTMKTVSKTKFGFLYASRTYLQ
jgi:hypothetical protein